MTAKYRKLGKHRKKCRICGKLIQDGEKVHIQKYIQEKYYPVKGIMRFCNMLYWHDSCADGNRFKGVDGKPLGFEAYQPI